MARLRTLKPGFFIDEYLAECQPLTRLLFAGLWTIADREGRLEDRPRRIKAECLPYDDCDVDALLSELARHDFIIRYGCEGKRFIAVPTWHKHQSPHMKESASTIPAPDKHDASTDLAPHEPPSSCLGSCLGSCHRSGIHEEPSLASDEANGLVLLEESVTSAHDPYGSDFLAWWSEYGKVGHRADAKPCYVFWRKCGVSAEKLLLASHNYIIDCHTAQRSIAHGSTFLAKKKTQEESRWLEWTTGEDHGDGHVQQRSGRQVDTTFGVLRQLIEEEA